MFFTKKVSEVVKPLQVVNHALLNKCLCYHLFSPFFCIDSTIHSLTIIYSLLYSHYDIIIRRIVDLC